jgi:hypothetical protein
MRLQLDYFSKYLGYLGIVLIAFLIPIKREIIFIGGIVIVDWVLGMINGAINEEFQSSKVLRKLFVSIAYFSSIFLARGVEMYWNIQELMVVKAVMSIILLSELQSIREKIIGITGLDILKVVVKIFEKNGNKKGNSI